MAYRFSGGEVMVDIDLIRRALAEDLAGGNDITSVATVSGDEHVIADFTARKSGVIAGIDMAIATLREVGLTDITQHLRDGDRVEPGSVLITVRGDTRAILLAERTALNFLGHLGGIATLTDQWVAAVAGTKTVIRDTRKTTPGLRLLEKAAVVAGGGTNHRLSLSDAALIKDNHIAAAGGVIAAFSKVRTAFRRVSRIGHNHAVSRCACPVAVMRCAAGPVPTANTLSSSC